MTDARDEGAGVDGRVRTVVFLFSDVEGSTRLLERDEAATIRALDRLGELLAAAVHAEAGRVFRFTGDGLHATFDTAAAAMRAAIAAQAAVRAEDWGSIGRLRVRMAIHAGDAEPRETDWTGPALFRCARLLELAHGGQVIVSGVATREGAPASDWRLHPRGTRMLRDLRQPEDVFELVGPGAAPDPRPLRGEDRRPGDPTTTPVGRADDLDALTAALDGHRLVTVTGLGGTGKTTLARAFAAGRDDGRTWFIELVGIASGDAVPSAVAIAVGAGESEDEELEAAIGAALGRAPCLLVLDNMEHVLDARGFVERLLAALPDLRVLVTSRHPLGLAGEVEHRLAPLAVPGPDVALDDAPASRVFLDRARERGALRSLGPDDEDAVRELCMRLDGLPLALELAARWTTLLSPRAIVRRLEERRLALAADPLTGQALARHASVAVVVESTLDLTAAADHPLFDAFGVLTGPATEAAIGAVSSVVDVLPGLLRLEAVGLVRTQTIDDGEPRFDALQPVRDVAAARLMASGSLDDARRRHVEFFEAVALSAAVTFRESTWSEAGRALLEDPNLAAAYGYAMAAGDAPRAVSLAASMATRELRAGVLREPLGRLERALALGPVPPSIEADALNILANLHFGLGRLPVGSLTGRAVGASREAGDPRRLVRTLNTHASIGNPPDAIEVMREAVATAEAEGYAWGIAVSNINLAGALVPQGRLDEALVAVVRSRSAFAGRGDELGVAFGYLTEGEIRAAQGLPADARRALRAADDIRRRLGGPVLLASIPAKLAVIEAELGNTDGALGLLLDAAVHRGEGESIEDLVGWLEAAGIVLAERHPAAATRALAVVDAHPQPLDVPHDRRRRERAVASTVRRLGARRVEAEQAAALAVPIADVVARVEAVVRRDAPAGHGRLQGEFGTLSAREQEVLALLADGATDGQIGERLGISPKTASVHVANLKAKLGADTRVGAVLAAQRILGHDS